MTAPTPDAVAQAREKYDSIIGNSAMECEYHNPSAKRVKEMRQEIEAAWAEVLAAVRAECAADTKRLDWLATKGNDWEIRGMKELSSGSPPKRLFIVGHGDNLAMGHAVHERDEIALRSAIDAAMEAQP